MNAFITALETQFNETFTTNGAKAYASTECKNLDLFGKIAASRSNPDSIVPLFQEALREDPETAIRVLFWARDIRGGQGERSVFRTLLKDLAKGDPQLAAALVPLVPVYGRWDDLLELEDTLAWNTVLSEIRQQLEADCGKLLQSDPSVRVSLLGKWLPSINASSKDSKRQGRKIAAYLGWDEKTYRQTLTSLRSAIRIVEQQMCAREWDQINYGAVPSQAALMYRKAFREHDPDRYNKYIESVKRGESKINASTIYPYQIVQNFLKGNPLDRILEEDIETVTESDEVLNTLWEALPDFLDGRELQGLVVADVSGSMEQNNRLPLAVSISLALYIAERNKGAWNGKFLTFSGSPSLVTINGHTISEKVRYIAKADWGGNTNLQAVFDKVLNAACKRGIPQEEMPKKLIIVSDMQFDQATRNYFHGKGYQNDATNLEVVDEKFANAGYQRPELVFWNVNSHGNVPMTLHDNGTCLVSGCSPSILKAVLTDGVISPLGVMKDAVYVDRYAMVGEVVSSLK